MEPLSKIAHFLNGLALQKYPVKEGEPSLPVIKIAELRSGSTAKSDRASVNLPPEYRVSDGDHLFSWSGSLTHCRWTHGPGALNQHLFKVTPAGVPDWLVYEAVEYHLPEFQEIASEKAVTMGHIQRHHLEEAMVALPPKRLLKTLDAAMTTLHERSFSVALQSRTLSNLRDTLLPKLISGELRIAHAENRISAA
jgi:type I restriction enzyme S subunit